ncbi:acyltransferase family protein [Microbacterium sp. F2]|uniref:acyltransferase family protein n=1 Tax=Microbacterium sp. F2 TaxID=3422228 RepID=UPI003FD33E37
MKERSAAIDAVRVIGMLAVIAGHIWITQESRQWIYTWQLPLFFILTGYLWSGTRSFRSEIAVRARTLLLPYVSWFAIIAVIAWSTRALQDELTFGQALRQVWGGAYLTTPFWAFWFAPALFVAVAAYYWVARLHLGWQWLLAIGLLAIAAYSPGRPMQYLPLSIGQGLAVVVFIVAGRSIRLATDRRRHAWIIGASMMTLGVVLVISFPTSYVDVKSLHFGVPIVGVLTSILVGGGLTLLANTLFGWMRGRTASIAVWLSMASLVVMFVHVPIADAFGWLASGSMPGFVVVAVLSWAIGLVLIALPRTAVLTGVRGAPPSLRPPEREDRAVDGHGGA